MKSPQLYIVQAEKHVSWRTLSQSATKRRLDLSRTFFKRIIETTRMSSGISCQPSVMFNLRLDCVVLDDIQQSMHELIVIKLSHCIWTKSLALTSVPFYCIMHALYTVVCLCNPAFVKGRRTNFWVSADLRCRLSSARYAGANHSRICTRR